MTNPPTSSNGNARNQMLVRVGTLAFAVFLVLAALTMALRLYVAADGFNDRNELDTLQIETDADGNPVIDATVVEQMQAIEQRANDAVGSAELILSFLEGATVLVGIAVGAAALFGFSQIRDIRDDVNNELDRVNAANDDIRQDFDTFDELLTMRLEQFDERIQDIEGLIEPVKPDLEQLSDITDVLHQTREDLELAINNVTWLLQADQEFRLGNWQEAHRFVEHVLAHNKEHPLALYIGGWLKVHYLVDSIDEGIAHLETLEDVLKQRDLVWPTAEAAYGVGLRRKGRAMQRMGDPNYEWQLRRAETIIEGALQKNGNLMDFNRESFWGPIGGIRRDLGRIKEAIEAYEKALAVTPGSSYPQGNLAALYLRQARVETDAELIAAYHQKAREAFERTNEFARAELSHAPNDYYNLMDIAMSYIMMGNTKEGRDYLDRAMDIEISSEVLNVSLTSGWRELQQHCPDEWPDIHAEIENAIKMMEQAVAERKAKETQASESNLT